MTLQTTESGVLVPQEREERMPASQRHQPTDLISAIAQAASNPLVDVEKMERLMSMHERLVAQQAQQAFQAAMAQMQPELPVVRHRGDAAGRYTYALWEDVHRALTPILSRYGFALFFKTDTSDAVRVMGTLTHAEGHREDTSITLPADGSGNKNAVQAVASSVAYGKRYVAGALLNFATTGEDDDVQSYGGHEQRAEHPERITEEQRANLQARCEAVGIDIAAFCKAARVESLADLTVAMWPKALARVEAREKAEREKRAAAQS